MPPLTSAAQASLESPAARPGAMLSEMARTQEATRPRRHRMRDSITTSSSGPRMVCFAETVGSVGVRLTPGITLGRPCAPNSRPVRIEPSHREQEGAQERMHQTLKAEKSLGAVADFSDDLSHRPHCDLASLTAAARWPRVAPEALGAKTTGRASPNNSVRRVVSMGGRLKRFVMRPVFAPVSSRGCTRRSAVADRLIQACGPRRRCAAARR